MATRALAAITAITGRRAAGHGGLAAVLSPSVGLACCRVGGGGKAQSFVSHSSSTAEADAKAANTKAAAQVEAALNRKNVDVVQGDRSATLLAADAGDAEDAWVPDQETGVFVPADEASSGDGTGNGSGHTAGSAPPSSSVLDQAVFVREEDMEDVERPAVGGTVDDMAGAGAGAK